MPMATSGWAREGTVGSADESSGTVGHSTSTIGTTEHAVTLVAAPATTADNGFGAKPQLLDGRGGAEWAMSSAVVRSV